jgi:hypothetical protein
VTVIDCVGLAVPNCCCPKLNAMLERLSVAGSTPLPLNAAVCVPAESVIVSVPERVPEAVGRNATDTVHPELAPSVVSHVFAVIAKSPETVSVCSATVPELVFEIVMSCTALVLPTFVPEYVTETGFNTTAPAAVAVPVRATVAWPPVTFA